MIFNKIHHRKNLSTVKSIFFYISATFFTFGIFILINQLFRIKTIEVIGNNISININEDKIPKLLIFFPVDSIRNKLIDEYPQLKDIKIEKKFPFTLKIIVTPRIPQAKIQFKSRQALIDRDGIVFSIADKNVIILPVIDFRDSDYADGEKVKNKAINSSILFLSEIKDLEITQIRKYDQENLLVSIGTLEVLIPIQNEYSNMVSTLQMIVTRFRMKGTIPKRIDLRFAKPVLTF